jgi:hypothetical protein
MAIFTKEFLSGSVNGRPIKITATVIGSADTIHTAVAGVLSKDEVWLYVSNNHTASVELTVAYGGTTSPDDYIIATLTEKQGLYLVVPGLVLNNGLIVKAFASVANVLSISGFINRIAP